MPVIPVMKARVGDLLDKDVQTALGSILLEEGRKLTERDLEILQAFLIPFIEVKREGLEEQLEEVPNADAGNPSEIKLSALQQAFKEMEAILKRSFSMVASGMKLPVLELRNGLQSLLAHIDNYNVISFQVPSSDDKESVMYRNSVLCAMTSYMMAKWCKFPEKDWMQIAMAGLLHDIGNVKVDPEILYKTSRLTEEERQEIRQHTIYGLRILEGVASLNQGVWLAALQHHERIDGSGYPLKVKGDKIHPYAKIVSITDVYHAMTSNRNYKKAESPYLVLEELYAEAFGKLDPVYVQTFIERTTQFHVGVFVRLSDGRIGEIVFSDRNNPTRPMVLVHGNIVNLMQERNLYIREVFATN
jgi:HD-GYP domain-containing protein (c-di-GMP phosphodiesterase class II)